MGWLDKNADRVPEGLTDVMLASTNPLVETIGQAIEGEGGGGGRGGGMAREGGLL